MTRFVEDLISTFMLMDDAHSCFVGMKFLSSSRDVMEGMGIHWQSVRRGSGTAIAGI